MAVDKLAKVVSQVLNVDPKAINNSLSRDSAEEWDSFNHLLLINTIEKTLKIKFTLPEVEKIKTFKQLKKIVAAKK